MAWPTSLIQTESGGNWGALNNVPGAGGIVGHGGRLQFGGARLQDAANAGIIPVMSPQDFAQQPPEVQTAVENWHFADIDRQTERMGLDRYIGQTVGGIPITQDAIRAMAHLGGMGGVQAFLQSGGRENRADVNGTSLADYARIHGGSGGLLSGGGGADTMTGGAGGDRMAGLLAPQERRPSIWDRLEGVPVLGGLADPDRRARLAVGLGGMSLNPNAMLMASNMQGIEQRAQERETTQRMNQTIAYLQSVGRDDLVALVQAGMDPGSALQESARQPEPVQPIEINGQLVDPTTGAVIGDYRTPEAVAPGFTVMTPEEVAALGLPAGSVWQRGPNGEIEQVDGSGIGTSYIATGDAAASLGLDPQFSYNVESGPEGIRATRIGGEGPTTTVNVGAGESAFTAETGKLLAAEANAIVEQGAQAQRALGQIQQLEGALASAPQGLSGGLQRMAASLGIGVEGTDDITLANAIISQLVPQQRQPGSGPMSDADLALFRESLPRLSNTPGGNQKIVATMRAIAEYDFARGQIARRQQLGEIDAQGAADAYAALGNPLAEFSQGGEVRVRRYNPATGMLE